MNNLENCATHWTGQFVLCENWGILAGVLMFLTIALGEAASKELGKFDVPHFTLPHPSPRNRKLNDKKFLKVALDSCKVYLEK